MDTRHPEFRHALLRMLRAGTLQASLGCTNGECAQVEFQRQRTYHVHLTPRHAVLREREVEVVRRHANGRWRTMRPIVVHRDQLVFDRATGQLIATPSALHDKKRCVTETTR